MKKALVMTLGVATISLMAQEQQKEADDATLKGLILNFVCDTHEPPLDEQKEEGWRRPTVQDVAAWHDVSPERMTRVLEELVRERLSDMKEAKGDRKTIAHTDVHILLQAFKTFHGINTLALLRECALSYGFHSAVESYVHILGGGGDSADFLQEVQAKGYIPTNRLFYNFLRDTAINLREKKQNDEAEKFYAAMLNMIRREQDAGNADNMDKALCASLDGYAQSVQREQVAQRFVTSLNVWVRNRFEAIKTEIGAVPADKRIDLSKRFKLTPVPEWKDDNELLERIIVSVCGLPVPPNDGDGQMKRETLQEAADRNNISRERMAQALMDLGHLYLHRMRDYPVMDDGLVEGSELVANIVEQMKTFRHPHAMALFQECARFRDARVSYAGLNASLDSLGGIACARLFRDVITGGHLRDVDRRLTYEHLESIITGLKAGMFTDATVKDYHTFMLDIAQTEQSSSAFIALDKTLCKTLDGYAPSTQREQAIQKFLNSVNEIERTHFRGIQSEIDKIHADKRTDLSKRFKLAEQAKENGGN